ncbi:hypothetical protein DPMN_081242 [Dreissena polymorpha]|uniref:Uncharacterized protein n=1 Tax=Dreissena polymorpha TaxID=45954 RepID=A0A9D4BGC1_DREPO|nr:hypothetical protein DPMN_081242 [Dreissena polymorpha]
MNNLLIAQHILNLQQQQKLDQQQVVLGVVRRRRSFLALSLYEESFFVVQNGMLLQPLYHYLFF